MLPREPDSRPPGAATDDNRLIQECCRHSADGNPLVDMLVRATEGDIYIVGGSIRRAVLRDKGSGDLDLIIPNGDPRAFDALRSWNIPFEINRHGHHRYFWKTTHIDIFQPIEFFQGFHDVEGVLRYFDLGINALAWHVRLKQLLDPFGILSRREIVDPEINWRRWEDMSSFDLAVLAIRLARIMYRSPQLSISSRDARRLQTWVLPKLRDSDWAPLHERFPEGKRAFLQWFDARVLQRIRCDVSDTRTTVSE